MYLPPHFAQHDPAALHALMRAHPLATWVCQHGGELVVNHVPFLLDPARGPHGTLIGHVARANPVWQQPGPSVLVFHGPDAYITPNWYAAKAAHGKVVPTWNYAVVHAHGRPQALHEPAAVRDIVTRLTALHESREPAPWQVADAPPAYIEQLLAAIVGIEVPIERLVGKWKLGQNRPADDRRGVAAGLAARGDEALWALTRAEASK